jgi:5,10-methylenetetrahydromethanopterin reductase
MKIGIGLYPDQPARQLLHTAQLAERLGYASLWLPDSQLLWREMYALLGAIAATTKRIAIASAVTNPATRHPSVTASAFRTLDELSGGRSILGISIGDSALRTIGLAPATLQQFRDALAELRRLLSGDRGEAGLAYGGSRPIPIYVAASSPRLLELAGRLADGIILMNGVAPELVGAAIERVHDGARRAGRDPAEIATVVWAACHSSLADPKGSLAAVKFNIARTILRNLPGPVDALTRSTAETVRRRYDYAEHGDARAAFAALIPDALVPRFAFAGTPAEIAAQISALSPLGVGEVALAVPSAALAGPREEVIELLAPRLTCPTHRAAGAASSAP